MIKEVNNIAVVDIIKELVIDWLSYMYIFNNVSNNINIILHDSI